MQPRPLSIAIQRLIVRSPGGQTDEEQGESCRSPCKDCARGDRVPNCRTPVFARSRTEHCRFLPNSGLHLPIPDPRVRSVGSLLALLYEKSIKLYYSA